MVGAQMSYALELPRFSLMPRVSIQSGSSLRLGPDLVSNELREIAPVSTVSDTYHREAAPLDGTARLADSTLADPEIGFAAGQAARTASKTSSGNRIRLSSEPPYSSVRPLARGDRKLDNR